MIQPRVELSFGMFQTSLEKTSVREEFDAPEVNIHPFLIFEYQFG